MTDTILSKTDLLKKFNKVRSQTEALCKPLAIEDYVVQSIEDVSPAKWHLAHTTWFFEAFILQKKLKNYSWFDLNFHYIFNSYYHGMGTPFPRPQRGFLSRPTVNKIYEYRKNIDNKIANLIHDSNETQLDELKFLITLGLHHEQQHQELLLMDIKYNFSLDPTFPIYIPRIEIKKNQNKKLKFINRSGGTIEIGHSNESFCYDNELPRHQKLLNPYSIADRLSTNEEYLAFIEDGGYANPLWWLSDGWMTVEKNNWQAPLYWQKIDKKWHVFTLHGLEKLNLAEPVAHISYYEAHAFANWSKKRLPTEEEWEHFVAPLPVEGHFLNNAVFHPQAVEKNSSQFYGDLWEWTDSAYLPYPGYKPLPGVLSEYNGKFMSNQMVLRGGSCITPVDHIRATYRNFFQPDKRWQFSGIRLADKP